MDTFDRFKNEQKKKQQETLNRERLDQFRGVRKAERARILNEIREFLDNRMFRADVTIKDNDRAIKHKNMAIVSYLDIDLILSKLKGE